MDEWQSAAEKISQRAPNWSQLRSLLSHAKVIGPGEKLLKEAEAIESQRALLADPDPVQALLDETITVLRNALNHQVKAYNDERDQHLQSLASDANWQKLEAAQQQALLKKHGVDAPAEAKAASADELSEALDEVPLTAWEDRRKALSHRFDELRMEVAKLLEPKVVRVQLPKITVRDEAELEHWLADAKAAVLEKLKYGPVML